MGKIFQFTYIWITIFQSRQQKSTTYAIIDWKEKQSRTQGENQLIQDLGLTCQIRTRGWSVGHVTHLLSVLSQTPERLPLIRLIILKYKTQPR